MLILELLDNCSHNYNFEKYYNFLIGYNKNVNLTSITDKKEFYIKHFLDSLSVTLFTRLYGKVIDVGTGAGFPGIPLKLFEPKLDITLLDSSKKKN